MEKTKQNLLKNKRKRNSLLILNLNKMHKQEQKMKLNTLVRFKGTAIYPNFIINEHDIQVQD